MSSSMMADVQVGAGIMELCVKMASRELEETHAMFKAASSRLKLQNRVIVLSWIHLTSHLTSLTCLEITVTV